MDRTLSATAGWLAGMEHPLYRWVGNIHVWIGKQLRSQTYLIWISLAVLGK